MIIYCHICCNVLWIHLTIHTNHFFKKMLHMCIPTELQLSVSLILISIWCACVHNKYMYCTSYKRTNIALGNPTNESWEVFGNYRCGGRIQWVVVLSYSSYILTLNSNFYMEVKCMYDCRWKSHVSLKYLLIHLCTISPAKC